MARSRTAPTSQRNAQARGRSRLATGRGSQQGLQKRPGMSRMNTMAVWAMVLSLLGITAPIGLYLGYRARTDIARTRQYGEPFAQVAIIVGWAYVAVAVVAILAYLIVFQLS